MKYTRTPTGIMCQYGGHTVNGINLVDATRKMFVLMRRK
jgi:hypothetical protein